MICNPVSFDTKEIILDKDILSIFVGKFFNANSILYVDNSINCLNIDYIKNNTFHILSEYRTYIHQNAYEFFYYDKSIAELRQDYHNFKY